jgi:hypothetical protein
VKSLALIGAEGANVLLVGAIDSMQWRCCAVVVVISRADAGMLRSHVRKVCMRRY